MCPRTDECDGLVLAEVRELRGWKGSVRLSNHKHKPAHSDPCSVIIRPGQLPQQAAYTVTSNPSRHSPIAVQWCIPEVFSARAMAGAREISHLDLTWGMP